MIAFGPIPSRRLGQSLGINNIPPKSCSYECVYCQVGPTPYKTTERRSFYEPARIFREVQEKVFETQAAGISIDYLSVVPDGEPTLDLHLGETLSLLRSLELPIAVITNGSLLWRGDVRDELAQADLVSIKIDSTDESAWRRINRPSAELMLPVVLEGMLLFARDFRGTLITETMLIQGINDDPYGLAATAAFAGQLHPHSAYLAIPTRPPFEPWAKAPEEQTLTLAYRLFSSHVDCVELLTGFSGDPYAATGDPANDLLGITSVHPMRESEVITFLSEAGANGALLDDLLNKKELVRVQHGGQVFYVRRLKAGA